MGRSRRDHQTSGFHCSSKKSIQKISIDVNAQDQEGREKKRKKKTEAALMLQETKGWKGKESEGGA